MLDELLEEFFRCKCGEIFCARCERNDGMNRTSNACVNSNCMCTGKCVENNPYRFTPSFEGILYGRNKSVNEKRIHELRSELDMLIHKKEVANKLKQEVDEISMLETEIRILKEQLKSSF